MKIPLWLIAALLSIACASAGQIFLKIGVRGALPSDAIRHPFLLLAALLNPYVILGTAAYAISMILWLGAISGQALSVVYPMAALGYVLVSMASVWLFGDAVTPAKVFGITLIIIGIIVLNTGVTKPIVSTVSAAVVRASDSR